MRRAALLVLATALAAAGCGGGDAGGPKTFDDEEFAISFQYPGSFEELEDASIASTAGAALKETRALGLNEQNVILVDRYDLRIEVTQENLADVKPEFRPGRQPGRGAGGSPQRTDSFLVLFHGATEYALNCQSTPQQRDEVDAACRLVVDTLEPK